MVIKVYTIRHQATVSYEEPKYLGSISYVGRACG